MENVIKNFLQVGDGYGSGDGSGYGSGCGFGSGDGSGYGSGYGFGSGYGDGSGDGSGYGSGDGSGYGSGCGSGYGDGSGDGSGYGSGDGDGLINIQGNNLYMIDEIPTIIYKIKNNIAFGAIINKDLTFKKCYIAKVGDCFAHGESIKKALNDAQVKFNNNLSEDEKISLFFKEFDIFKKYKALKFYDWHNILTGSCSFGRKSFMENNNIKETDMLNVAQFVELTENQYNGQIIKKIKINLNKKHYEKKRNFRKT